MKAYMASPDWSENVPSFFSRDFPLAKILCKNNWKWLKTEHCFDSYNIQSPVWRKTDSSFWQEYSELIHMSGVMNNEINKQK